jgi:hypothetical protein
MITIDSVTDNKDGTVTIQSHDDQANTYTNIIGLSNTPTPTEPISTENMSFYTDYVESTIPPAPEVLYSGD